MCRQIIISCIFNNIETFCPGAKDDDDLDTFLREVQWKLPNVRWDYTASPPPPPPSQFGSFHDLVAADPDGMEELREKLLEFFPSLTYVASQTYGNSNPSREALALECNLTPAFTRFVQVRISAGTTAPGASDTVPCTTFRATPCPRPTWPRRTFAIKIHFRQEWQAFSAQTE